MEGCERHSEPLKIKPGHKSETLERNKSVSPGTKFDRFGKQEKTYKLTFPQTHLLDPTGQSRLYTKRKLIKILEFSHAIDQNWWARP